MPTGYTAAVAEGKLTAREYLLSCSRAFGALIHMRDDSFDIPIVMREESTYHTDRLEELNRELNIFVGITANDAWNLMQNEYNQDMKHYNERIAENEETAKNYEKMLFQIRAWNPPTSDHAGLKEFAIQQIVDSIKFDTYAPNMPNSSVDIPAWIQNKLNKINAEIKYHTEKHEEEKKRVVDANAWITSLIESLP